jgi:transcriptional regulator with XRE-family HTH domain
MLFQIGRQIQLARKSRKVTQAELGKALGMSRTTIGQIERGTVQDIGERMMTQWDQGVKDLMG